jgi:hypothetical protein
MLRNNPLWLNLKCGAYRQIVYHLMKDYFYVLKGGAELKNVHGGDSTNKYI